MTNYTAYWMATFVRGAVALFTSIVVMLLTDAAATILLRAVAIVLAFLAIGAYVVMDSSIVLATSFMLPHHPGGRIALRVQGVVGMAIGVLYFLLASETKQLSWFLYLAAIQALSVAVAEFLVARRSAAFHDSNWCYASSMIALLSSILLFVGHRATERRLGLLICSYLGLFGINQFVLAAHMLFEEFRAAKLSNA